MGAHDLTLSGRASLTVLSHDRNETVTIRPTIAFAIAIGFLAGCAAEPGPFDAWTTDRANLDAYRVAADAPADSPPDDTALANLSDVEGYVRLALERNPSLAAARARIERMTERIPQAERLDDPMFTVAAGEMAETAAGRVDMTTGISQKLPLPQKLRTRGRVAMQDVVMAAAQHEQTKLEVAADVRRAYWSYYFATRAIDVTHASRQILAQFREVADTQFRAGRTGQQDLLRVSTELTKLESDLVTYRQQSDSARAMLNRMINRSPASLLPAPAKVELDAVTLSFDRLLADASLTNPQLAEARARIEQFRQRLKLAKLDDWPDLTVGVNYAAVDDDGLSGVASGDDQWWLSFGINLPIWREPREAAQREALRGIYENLHTLDDTHNRIAFRVQDALTRVEAQQKLLLLFRDRIIPESRQTLDASVTEYTTGESDFLNLIDNWRKLLGYELMQEQNLAAFERAMADLQEAVGRDVQRAGLNTTNPTPDPAKGATP